ncbi:MAG: C4-type zinc ribbon domain-containing protein [Thermodesulfobacteriota bacterium]|nr:C4-type zinc ribbon domain-containing protein [Thermodesulfobacteriota bacterium]
MQEYLNVLVKLQDLDSNIGRIQEAKVNYPQKIESLREKLRKEKSINDQKRERLKNLEQERRSKERNLEQEIVRIKKSEEKLLLVKSNKEYHAALKEIAMAKESNSEEEENILIILEELDILKKELVGEEENLKTMTIECEKEESALAEKLEEFEIELGEKTQSRNELLSDIDSEILKTYENIRKHRQGIAVVQAKDGFCQGCYMDIPPQLYNDVQRGDELLSCPNCNRLLYFTNDT